MQTFFITTDLGILKKRKNCKEALKIITPLEYWEEGVL